MAPLCNDGHTARATKHVRKSRPSISKVVAKFRRRGVRGVERMGWENGTRKDTVRRKVERLGT